MLHEWLAGLLGFVAAVAVGTFVEYLVHRFMHKGTLLGKKHAEHHRDGWGQGWLGEFWDYFAGSVPVMAAGFCVGYFLCDSLGGGLGFVAGGLAYACMAAYAHQVQHDRPELVFWLKRPVHYIHHKHKMWHHNFGITVDIWDRVFGTYKAVDWNPEKRPFQHPLRSFLQIRWY